MPIYHQIIDQIKYQIATGTLKERQQMPSVRQLAKQLAVNQNTVLKVYNQLCRENILHVARGSGTFVAGNAQTLRKTEMKGIVTKALRTAAVQAVHFGLDVQELHELLDKEYQGMHQHEKKTRSK